MSDVTKIGSEQTIILKGRFSTPFGKDPVKKYSFFIFEGGKFMIPFPPGIVPEQRVTAFFEVGFDFCVLNNGKTLECFRPTRFLMCEPCK